VKLAVNLLLSFAMLALCLWLVWPDAHDREQLETALEALHWSEVAPCLAMYLGLMAVSQVCRSLRWNELLAPLGISVPAGPLIAISSVGFMAIIALPARLGELVRPGLLRRRGISASAGLGTVAVERIIDGLMISMFVFGAFFAIHGPDSPGWMMPTAYIALGFFAAALVFLVFAMKRPEPTVRFCLQFTLVPLIAPRIGKLLETKLIDMIRGFAVLRDAGRLVRFCAWTVVYWGVNGLAVWVVAQMFHIELSVVGAFAVMGLVGVGITLPNSPGMVGQFQWFTLLGLSLYLPGVMEGGSHHGQALAYAIGLHVLQISWYVVTGALGLATPWVSFHDLRHSRDATPPIDVVTP
jgi:uncharacterized protein (TIRG00374 family)